MQKNKKLVKVPAASTTPLVETITVIGIMTRFPTLVTAVVGVKLSATGTAITRLSGHTIRQLNSHAGSTKHPGILQIIKLFVSLCQTKVHSICVSQLLTTPP